MAKRTDLKKTPIYNESVEGLNVISDVTDPDNRLQIIGGETESGNYLFMRFEEKDKEWSKNEDFIESDVIDFNKRLKAPKLRKKGSM